MAPLTSRYDLLRSRLTRLGRGAAQFGPYRSAAVETSQAAIRRLLVVLPLLKLDRDLREKLDGRLRKTSRRLKKVRDIDAIIHLMDDLHESDRQVAQALARIKENVRQSVGWPQVGKLRGEAGSDVRRLAEKLTDVSQSLKAREKHPVGGERTLAPLEARTARRAARLKQAIAEGGSVYMADRLRTSRRAVQRLRIDAELLADLSSDATAVAELRVLERTQAVLERMRDLQRLIERVRDAQSDVAPRDLKAWHELDSLIISLEARCRRWHARYVRDRDLLASICDRLVAKAPPSTRQSRKAS